MHYPQGNYKIHIDKIASCCWIRHSILDKLLCKSVTTCMNAYALRGRDSVVYLQAVQAERIQRGSVHAFFVYTTNRFLVVSLYQLCFMVVR